MIGKIFDIEFWAEQGVVYLNNEHKGAELGYDTLPDTEKSQVFKGLPPRVFLKRALALYALLSRMGHPQADEFMATAYAVYRQACDQGAFDDPKADEYKIKHKVNHKPQIWIPGRVKEEMIRESILKSDPKTILMTGFEHEDE